MRLRSTVTVAVALCSLALVAAGGGVARAGERPDALARQMLAARDGWASLGAGTTGGAPAGPGPPLPGAHPPGPGAGPGAPHRAPPKHPGPRRHARQRPRR